LREIEKRRSRELLSREPVGPQDVKKVISCPWDDNDQTKGFVVFIVSDLRM